MSDCVIGAECTFFAGTHGISFRYCQLMGPDTVTKALRVRALALHVEVGWLLKFYILATSEVISGWVPICSSVHSWRLYGAALLGDQVTRTMS